MRMNANEFGKRLGIGVRVAGRIAQQRAQQSNQAQSNQTRPASTESPQTGPRGVVLPPSTNFTASAGKVAAQTGKVGRAAGQGIGGFLRPFRRVGGILWLEVTGFFFGLFAIYFASDLWRTRLSYASGPQHQRFLIAAGMTAVFAYLSISAFWRAQRR